MTARAVPTTCLMLATAIAALLFAPVFGVPALLLPVGVPAATLLLGTLACARHPALPAWRPLLLAVAGLLAVAETSLWPTTVAGVPTGRTLRALVAGVTDSWQLTLQSTWPARPDPALLLFVPLLVVLAGVLGVELLHRQGSPLLALAPSLAVALLSQLYAPLPAGAATVAALGYAAAAGALLATTGGEPSGPRPTTGGEPSRPRPTPGGEPSGPRRHRVVAAVARAAPAAALAAVAAILAGLVVPAGPARYSLRQGRPAPLAETPVASPLDEITYRLAHPGVAAFRVRDAADVDRWPLVVLDAFDGVNWTSSDRYRRMGTALRQSPAVTAKVHSRSARIDVVGVGGPWLPSQTWPASVEGVAPLIEERHGTLLLPGTDGTARYTLTWWQPEVDAEALGAAPIEAQLPGGLGSVGTVPPGIAELARRAVDGVRPSFQAALALERYLRENYRLVVGEDLPTGHAWPKLADFLLRDPRGTSEQFAAAYVALARILSIPARLVVGFRAPARRDPDGGYTVHNGDVLAWPEVAVAKTGWVPLDPSGTAATGGVPGGGLAAVTAQARARLPATGDLRDPPVTRPRPVEARGGVDSLPWTALLGVPAALLVALLAGWLVGVPAAKAGRSWRRRRRSGPGAVVGAWEEVRDRLREHGVAVSAGMTVRDLATAATPVTDRPTVDALRRLAATVDRALWSPPALEHPHGGEAWAAVRVVRHGLARRGWRARLRAALNPRPLLPP